MKYVQFKARLKSPLMIHKNRQSNVSQGLPFLPGSSLRGAAAGKLIRSGIEPDHEAFRSLFIENPVCFPDLAPADNGDSLSRIIPLSNLSCKREPGFKKPGEDKQGKPYRQVPHGVTDRLAITAVSRKINAPPPAGELLCPRCRQEMKPITGFWNANTANPRRIRAAMFFRRHTGIHRTTGTVAASMYYISQAMADYYKPDCSNEYKPQYLVGATYMTGEQLERLKPLIQGTLFAGADRTCGMGELEITLEEKPAPTLDLDEWNRGFKTKLARCLEKAAPNALRQEMMKPTYFSIKMESHALLVDRFLRPTADLQLDFPGIEVAAGISKAHTVRGWQSAWGLPKPDDTGLEMGSVFLYQYTGTELKKLTGYLEELSITGIGLRREEGFGRVQVCDPFHTL
jgi:CRISPR-associated protein Csx10